MPHKSFFLTKINLFVVAKCHKEVGYTKQFSSLFQRFDDEREVVVLIGQHILLSWPGAP